MRIAIALLSASLVIALISASASALACGHALLQMRRARHVRDVEADEVLELVEGELRLEEGVRVRRVGSQLFVIAGRLWIDADMPLEFPHRSAILGEWTLRDGHRVSLIGDFSRLDRDAAEAGLAWPDSAIVVVGDRERLVQTMLHTSARRAAVALVCLSVSLTWLVLA